MAAVVKRRNNRRDGHDWEREIVRLLRQHGYPHAVTSRSANLKRDAEKIDIVNYDEHEHGRMFDDVQAKSTTKVPWQIIDELEMQDKGQPKRRKVLLLKLCRMIDTKTDKRLKQTLQRLAIMPIRDYLSMLHIVREVQRAVREGRVTDKALTELIGNTVSRKGHD